MAGAVARADSRLAPPASPSEFAKSSAAIVIGRLESQKPAKLAGTEMPVRALTFTVEEVIKAHANAHGERANLSPGATPARVTVMQNDHDDAPIRSVAFTEGERYVLFITWNEPLGVYTLHYNVSGAFRLVGTAVEPLDKSSDLAKNVTALTSTSFMQAVRTAVAEK